MVLLVFDAGERRYALHVEAVERVIRAVEITPVPDAPEDILGVINVYGRIIPVLNVRKRFALPDRDLDLNDHLILVQTSRWPFALWVDRVRGVVDYPIGKEVPIGEVMPDGLTVEGVLKLEEGLAFIEDLDRLCPLPPRVPSG